MSGIRSIISGAAAGAAGTTALNTVTYLDMVARSRPASSTPQTTVEKLSERTGLKVPGEGDARDNRVEGLAPLMGIATGVGTGLVLGVARVFGWRPGPAVGATAATMIALLGANGPMSALGVSDPRSWSASDWASDVIPHLAFGIVTAEVLSRLDRD